MSDDGATGEPWLLLIHQIPPKPDYFRVKIGRRLARVGAVALKNSVYVLPATDQGMEDFQWILREIVDGGGEASISRATFVDGLTDAAVERLFREARERDYREITAGAHAAQAAQADFGEDALARLRRRFVAVERIDFFPTPARDEARASLDALARRGRLPVAAARARARPSAGEAAAGVRGRTWVTREGVFVDRIASAWLIRRFIDPEARFKFVAPRGYTPVPGELRFDMFEAEYTHEGDRCTFETLLGRFDLDDPALAQIAAIVHDIDLRDGKFGRDDAPGVERVLAGIAAAHPDDAARLEHGAALFDGLYTLAAKEASVIDPIQPLRDE